MELLWDETDRPDWERLADTALAPIQQRWTYGEAARALGGNVARLLVRENGVPVAMAQFLWRRFVLGVALATRGPVWLDGPDPGTRVRVLAAIRRATRGLVLLSPATEDGALRVGGYIRVMSPATVALLALGGTPRKAVAAKWRNRLVAAEGAGLHVRCLTGASAAPDWLFAAVLAQQRARGYRALPPGFAAAWRAADAGSVTTLAAYAGGDAPVAAMMFLRHGRTATYHIGWSGPVGRALSAHNLLLWQAIERFAAADVERLDLGTLDTEAAPGLARFKLGTGARAERLGGTWIGW